MTYEEIRDKRGLKDADVARLAQVSPATLSEWRSGKYIPKIDNLRKVAAVLDCTIDDLVEGE